MYILISRLAILAGLHLFLFKTSSEEFYLVVHSKVAYIVGLSY